MTDQPKPRVLPPALTAGDIADYASFAGGGRNRSAEGALDPGLQRQLAQERRAQDDRITRAIAGAVRAPKPEGNTND